MMSELAARVRAGGAARPTGPAVVTLWQDNRHLPARGPLAAAAGGLGP